MSDEASKPASLAEFPFLPGLVPEPMEPSGSAGAEGHRLRMRQRLLKSGPDSLADHEMLEMILFIALPRRDTKPLARALLARSERSAPLLERLPPSCWQLTALARPVPRR